MQAGLVKEIVAKEGVTFIEGVKLLKAKYVKKAIGKPYVSGGDVSWADALQKVKDMGVKNM